LEKRVVLLYKEDVNLQFIKRCVLPGIFGLLLCAGAARAQEAENRLAPADQRRVIAVLLNEKFTDAPEKIIYITTANISAEVQKNFQPLKNKTIRFVSRDEAARGELCAYEFGEFQIIDKFVSVTFGNCREGLAYDFIRDGAEWKGVSSTVIREMLY
jgi:hypothetical protein